MNNPLFPDQATSTKNLSPEEIGRELRESMALHLRQKAQEIINKYGTIDYSVLLNILQDKKFTRYPVNVVFDSNRIEPGLFALTEAIHSDSEPQRKAEDDDDVYTKPPEQRFEIIIHEFFKDQPEKLLPLILYQLPIVNYGDVVTFEDSEVFGASMLEIPQDDYYQQICDLVDSIPS